MSKDGPDTPKADALIERMRTVSRDWDIADRKADPTYIGSDGTFSSQSQIEAIDGIIRHGIEHNDMEMFALACIWLEELTATLNCHAN